MLNKLKVVALVLAIALIFSGCSMITKNEDRVKNQIVATVNGSPIYRYQVLTDFKIYNFMGSYGTPVDMSKMTDTLKESLKSYVEDYAKQQVLVKKANELGLALTEDEKKANSTKADELFTYIKDGIKSQVEEAAKTDSSIDVAAKTESEYKSQLDLMAFTAEDYTNYLNEQSLVSKIKDYTDKDAAVTDDDVTKWYNDTLAVQQADMDKTPSTFATDFYANKIITYIPEDTVAVKQVLLSFKDTDLTEVAKQLYTDGDTSEAMAILKPEIDALMPQAQDIAKQLKGGAKIDELIAKYGEDPGMAAGGSRATTGYLVGSSTKDYLQPFTDAALKLTKVGDTSDPVTTYYGIHVLQTIKVYTKGVISLDTLKDQIKTALLPVKQDEKLKEMEEKWQTEAKITYDKERLYN